MIGNLVQRLSVFLYLFSHLCHMPPEKLKYKPDGRKPFVRRGCAYSGRAKNQDWVLGENIGIPASGEGCLEDRLYPSGGIP